MRFDTAPTVLPDNERPTSVERFARWRLGVHAEVATAVRTFVEQRCAEHIAGVDDLAVLDRVLTGFVQRGKYLRSMLMMAGWSTGHPQSDDATLAATRAAASMELLHCFALLQDDVMDGSPIRRGAPSAHVEFGRWHSAAGLAGPAGRFGESAAVLAGDLCLVWADQMLRESGVDDAALARVLPRYDRLRSELAVGQFRDLINEARRQPTLRAVREVARAKSGNYTVRRPVELGAALAGTSPAVLDNLGRYGAAIGEAFQLRDDLLGLFGSPEVTGKPVGEDLYARKATYVVVLTHGLADRSAEQELARLDDLETLTPADVERYLDIITETGARAHTERFIEDCLAVGLAAIETTDMPDEARERLGHLGRLCVDRNR